MAEMIGNMKFEKNMNLLYYTTKMLHKYLPFFVKSKSTVKVYSNFATKELTKLIIVSIFLHKNVKKSNAKNTEKI